MLTNCILSRAEDSFGASVVDSDVVDIPYSTKEANITCLKYFLKNKILWIQILSKLY